VTSKQLKNTSDCGKINNRKALMTGVAASRTGNPFWGIHRKGGIVYDGI
jgi:hypothetical protein